MHSAKIHVASEQLLLHPGRALFWPRLQWLVLGDLHLGKAAHFRKAGVPLPEGNDERTLARLDALIAHFSPKRVVIIGDLFHSAHNQAWLPFHAWCGRQRVDLHLVTGNHDRLADRRYRDAGLTLHTDGLREGAFRLEHEPPSGDPGEQHVICGHLHPGVVLHGRGDQRLRLACFVMGERSSILPAFGSGTGLHVVKPKRGDRIFACAEQRVMEVTGLVVPSRV